jgi:hypothetical protein
MGLLKRPVVAGGSNNNTNTTDVNRILTPIPSNNGVASSPHQWPSPSTSSSNSSQVTKVEKKSEKVAREPFGFATMASIVIIVLFALATQDYLQPPHSAHTSVAASAVINGDIDSVWSLIGSFNQVS